MNDREKMGMKTEHAAIEICTAADGKNLKSALNEFKIAWR